MPQKNSPSAGDVVNVRQRKYLVHQVSTNKYSDEKVSYIS